MKTKRALKTQQFGPEQLQEMLDDEQQKDFDALVKQASAGDDRAIGAIAAALGPMLLEDARTVLEEFEEEADEVLWEFLQGLVERRFRYGLEHGDALPWMSGVVQGIAHLRCRQRERDEADMEES